MAPVSLAVDEQIDVKLTIIEFEDLLELTHDDTASDIEDNEMISTAKSTTVTSTTVTTVRVLQ